jgi:hypothetical protein
MSDMLRIRRSTRFLLLWTALCGVALVLLAPGLSHVADPRCFEYCDLVPRLASLAATVVIVVWLAVVLLVAWLRDRR